MHFKALVSAIALGAAVSLAGPVSAQEAMINGVTIPDDEMAAVQARCDELAQAAENEPIAGEAENDVTDDAGDDTGDDGDDADNGDGDDTGNGGDTTADDAGEADATIDDAPAVNEIDNALTSTIDLDTIDLQACIDAGLVDDVAR